MLVKEIGVPGYSGYFVSEDGRVWSERKNRWGRVPFARLLVPRHHRDGYVYYRLTHDLCGYRPVSAHRAVAFTFIGHPPDGDYEVRHLDGDKKNNHVSNLCWGTPKENCADNIRLGIGKRILSKSDVEEILVRADAGETQRVIAQEFGITQTMVSRLKLGRAWTWHTGRSILKGKAA